MIKILVNQSKNYLDFSNQKKKKKVKKYSNDALIKT